MVQMTHLSPSSSSVFNCNILAQSALIRRILGAPHGATAVHSMSLSTLARPPMVGVDVADVLSVKNVQNADGAGLECIPRATKSVIYVVNYT